MQGKTTIEAFVELTNERGWYTKVPGLNAGSARRLKSDAKNGRVSTDKIEEVLEKAGFKVVQTKLWKKSE